MSKREASLLVSAANALSLIRLFAAPGIVFLIWRSADSESSRFAALWLILGLHAGDILDGYLARKGSQRLRARNYFGEIIDPVADKLYIGAGFVTMALTDQFHGWFAGLVVARDAAIIVGWSLIYRRTNIRLLPNMAGKLTDGVQAGLLCVVLLRPATSLLEAATLATASLILYSGYSYARLAQRALAPAVVRRRPARVSPAARNRTGTAGDGIVDGRSAAP